MWNGSITAPNWAGTPKQGEELYIVESPNPRIGIVDGNEVDLPRRYKNFEIRDLVATNINGNPNFDAANWWRYQAKGNVTAEVLQTRQFDLTGWKDIKCTNLTCELDPLTGGSITAQIATVPNIIGSDANFSTSGLGQADVNIYGANLVSGDNALYVEGGTTLTGGGIVHGVTLGALQVGGIDTVRIDVLPIGMSLVSATYITMEAVGAANLAAGGAASVAAGGALSLAAGSYIEYNSDQHYFKNTSAGNDYTDIYVGNIHGADQGSQPLNINETRGVQLGNVTSINLQTNFVKWDVNTTYGIDNNVFRFDIGYRAIAQNRGVSPNLPIQNWKNTTQYYVDNIVFVAGVGSYRCIVNIISNTSPNGDGDNWAFFNDGNNITTIWKPNNQTPIVSTIAGDSISSITIGTVNTGTLNTTTTISAPTISTNAISAFSGDTVAITDNLLLQDKNISNVTQISTRNIIAPPGNDLNLLSTINANLFSIYDANNVELRGKPEDGDATFGLARSDSETASFQIVLNDATGITSLTQDVSNLEIKTTNGDMDIQSALNLSMTAGEDITLNGNRIILNATDILTTDINLQSHDLLNVKRLQFNPYVGIETESIDGVDYIFTKAPLKCWNFQIIEDSGTNSPGFRLKKDTGANADIFFDGETIQINQLIRVPAIQVINTLSVPEIAGVETINGHNLFASGAFQMNLSQFPNSINMPDTIRLDTSVEAYGGVDLYSNKVYITMLGVYQVTVNANCGYVSGDPGTINVWLKQNSVNIPNSCLTGRLSSIADLQNLSMTYMISCLSGDEISAHYASSNVGIGLSYAQDADGIPLRPAFSLSFLLVH